jgi:hypothetical protein
MKAGQHGMQSTWHFHFRTPSYLAWAGLGMAEGTRRGSSLAAQSNNQTRRMPPNDAMAHTVLRHSPLAPAISPRSPQRSPTREGRRVPHLAALTSTRAGTDNFKYIQRPRRAVADLFEMLPEELQNGPEASRSVQSVTPRCTISVDASSLFARITTHPTNVAPWLRQRLRRDRDEHALFHAAIG